MAIDREDLVFGVKIDPDLSQLDKMDILGEKIANQFRQTRDVVDKIGPQLMGVNAQLDLSQLDKMDILGEKIANQFRQTRDVVDKIGPQLMGVNAQLEQAKKNLLESNENDLRKIKIQQQITAEYAAQEARLEKLKELSKPENVRKKVAMDLKVEEAQKVYQRQVAAEKKDQQGGLWGQMKGQVSDFFKDFKAGGLTAPGNRQLIGSALGATASGGLKAGLSSVIGGAAGAMGGPVGMAVMAAPAVAKVVGDLAASPFKSVADGLGSLNQGLKSLGGTIGPVALGFDAMAAPFDSMAKTLNKIPLVGDALAAVPEAIGAIPKQLKAVTETLTAMGRLASPSTYRRLQMAIEDTQAVIGLRWVPAMELMRDITRGVGDFIDGVLPSQSEMREIMAPLKDAWEDFKTAMEESGVGNFVKQMVVGTIRLVTNTFTLMTRAATMAAYAMKPVVDFLQWIGLMRTDFAMGSSAGAAARPAQITGLEQYQRNLQTAAFRVPGTMSVEEGVNTIAQDVSAIRSVLDAIAASTSRTFQVLGRIHAFVTGNWGAAFGGEGSANPGGPSLSEMGGLLNPVNFIDPFNLRGWIFGED